MKKLTSTNVVAKAFTLVELLVVIGIIALLISVLLPSLNRARQQANLVKCQSNLRSVGQTLSIYYSENRNYLPLGLYQRFNVASTPENKQTQWFWTFALGEVLNKKLLGADGFVHGLDKIFTDTDTIDGPDRAYVSHFTANPRLFYNMYINTFGTLRNPIDVMHVSMIRNRKITDVKQSSNVFAIWDGAQATEPISTVGGKNYNANETADGIDGYGMYFTGLCYPNGDINSIQVAIDLPILPTMDPSAGTDDGTALQKSCNVDIDAYSTATAVSPRCQSLRFRHMKNTTMDALCLDGHCETRRVGTVLRRDIYTNVP